MCTFFSSRHSIAKAATTKRAIDIAFSFGERFTETTHNHILTLSKRIARWLSCGQFCICSVCSMFFWSFYFHNFVFRVFLFFIIKISMNLVSKFEILSNYKINSFCVYVFFPPSSFKLDFIGIRFRFDCSIFLTMQFR